MHTDCLIIVMHTLVDSMQFYKYRQCFEDDSQELKIKIKQSSTMLFLNAMNCTKSDNARSTPIFSSLTCPSTI